MYFLEFLETCTIRWVWICEGGVGVGNESAFFILVGEDGTHHPHPGLRPHSPQVETPAPAHLDRLHITGSRAGRARSKADHARQGAHAAPGRSHQRRTLEAAQRVRNCADLDAQTEQQNRPKNHHFFVYVCCLCNFTNTQKSVIIMPAKAYTKKCKSHITKHQNRRTKP